MKLQLSVAALAVLSCVPIHGASIPPPIPVTGYRLVWSDEFDGNHLDMTKWDYRADSKMWSTQKPDNVTVRDGKLVLILRKENEGKMNYTGGGVISRESFLYGYYEARLKIPPGAGWHTSFWMMLHNGKGGTGHGLACQELDVIENDPINHYGYGVNVHKWKGAHIAFGGKGIKTPDLSTDFHVYGCEFTPSTVNYYFDGRLVQSVDVTKAQAKSNIQVDFEYGPQHTWLTSIASPLGHTKNVDESLLPATAEFDYVRFYEKTSSSDSRPASPPASSASPR
jgi:beta-glucanase (GH16 family)